MTEGTKYWNPDLPAGEKDCPEYWQRHFDNYDADLTRGRYHRVLGEMRESCPVAHSDQHEDGYYVLTRFEDVQFVHKNPEIFSSYPVVMPWFGNLRPMIPVESDPPLQKKYRTIVNPFFSRAKQAEKESIYRQYAVEYVEQFAGRDSCDAVTELCYPFVLRVLIKQIGVPEEEVPTVSDIGERLVAMDTSKGNPALELYAYFTKLIAMRRENPGDDIVTVLTQGEIDGEPLSDMEILDYCMAILPAGFETTASAFAYAMLFLAENPNIADELRQNPDQIPKAVEEIVRYVPPIRGLYRTVMTDVEVNGHQFKRGDRIMVNWAAANRDPDAFDKPDELDVTRHPNRHVGFGHGAHLCLGIHMARLELKVGLEETLKRLNDIRIADVDGVAERPGATWNMERLPLTFSYVPAE